MAIMSRKKIGLFQLALRRVLLHRRRTNVLGNIKNRKEKSATSYCPIVVMLSATEKEHPVDVLISLTVTFSANSVNINPLCLSTLNTH